MALALERAALAPRASPDARATCPEPSCRRCVVGASPGRRPEPARPPGPAGRGALVAPRGRRGAARRRRRAVLADQRPGVQRSTRASVALEGLRYTDEADVRAEIGLRRRRRPVNIVRSRPGAWRRPSRSCRRSPARRVRATLPDVLTVDGHGTASPSSSWSAGDDAWLVDVDGPAVRVRGHGRPRTSWATAPRASGCRRSMTSASSAAIGPGRPARPPSTSRWCAAGRRHARAWSAARRRSCTCRWTTTDGWVLDGTRPWRAVFGHYTQTLRAARRIPSQVQCLRSLLREREETVDRGDAGGLRRHVRHVPGRHARAHAEAHPEPPRPTRTPKTPRDGRATPRAVSGRDMRVTRICDDGGDRHGPAVVAPAHLGGQPDDGKGSGGDRSGPRRARCRHEQGRGAGRRGHPRGRHQHHRQGHRARDRPQEGRS